VWFKTRWKKLILARAIGIKKENWGVTTHLSEIIEPKFGKKLSYMYFNTFLELWMIDYL